MSLENLVDKVIEESKVRLRERIVSACFQSRHSMAYGFTRGTKLHDDLSDQRLRHFAAATAKIVYRCNGATEIYFKEMRWGDDTSFTKLSDSLFIKIKHLVWHPVNPLHPLEILAKVACEDD